MAQANAARDSKDWPTAARFYEHYLESHRDEAPIWVQLGHARKESGDLARAGTAYDAAAKLAPNDSDIHLQIGHLKKLRGEPAKAVEYYKRALELGPANEDAMRELRLAGITVPSAETPGSATRGIAFADIGSRVAGLEIQLSTLLEHVSSAKALAFVVTRQGARLDEIVQRISLTEDQVSRTENQGLEAGFVEQRFKHLDSNISSLLEHVSVAKALSFQLQSLKANVDEIDKKSEAILQQKGAAETELNRFIQGELASLRSALDEVSESGNLGEAHLRAFGERLSELDEKIARMSELDARQSAEAARIAKGMGAQISRIEQGHTTATARFEQMLEAKVAGSEQALAANVESLREDYSSKLNNIAASIEHRLLSLAEDHGIMVQELRANLRAHEASLSSLRNAVEAYFIEANSLRSEAAANVAESQAIKQAGDNLQRQVDVFSTQAEATLKYLLGRVEFVRREVMYELHYASQPLASKPAAAKAEVKNDKKVAAARSSGLIRLNVGSGHIVEPDYINVDRRDLPGVDVVAEADDLPFAKASITEIRSSHLVEHFPQEALARGILPYWLSLLKPGGKFLATAPDGKAMVEEYTAGAIEFGIFREVIFGSQEYAGDFHYNILTPESFEQLLRECGFVDVRIIARHRRNGLCFEFEVEGYKPRPAIAERKATTAKTLAPSND